MEMPSLFKRLFSKKVKVQPLVVLPAPPPPRAAAAPMTQEELQAYIALTVLAIVGVTIVTFGGGPGLRDSSMKLLASVANEASAKIEALKKSSQ